MTGPGGDTAALVQAVKDNAHRLGLTWQLQFAAVADGQDPAKVKVRFDADASLDTPDVLSLVGAIPDGERVAVVTIPEGGAYVVGRLDPPSDEPVIYRDGASTATGVSAISAETTILTLALFRFKAGRAYKVEFRVDLSSSTATNNALWRIRRGSIAGAIMGAGVFALRSSVGGSNDSGSDMVIRNTTSADVVDNLLLTITTSGGGTINFVAGATQVGWIRVYELGAATRFANAVSV